jgi:hypothetical protein
MDIKSQNKMVEELILLHDFFDLSVKSSASMIE